MAQENLCKERQRTEAHLPENETTALTAAATIHRRDGEEEKKVQPKRSGAFALVFRTRYLLLIAFLIGRTTGWWRRDSRLADRGW